MALAVIGGPRARDLHPVGHDPRPLAQPRRPALRPVHDPPAAALLDVLAGGAARGPGHLRDGRRAGAGRASPSRATSSTRSSSTASSASPSPATACATTTASAASCCSAICTTAAWCSGRTTGCSSTGTASRARVGELRELVEELYRHGIETSKVTYWIAAHDLVSALRDAQHRVAVARRGARLLGRGRAARLDRPGARRRVPAQHVLRALKKKLVDSRACLSGAAGRSAHARSPATTTPACTPPSSRRSPPPTRAGRGLRRRRVDGGLRGPLSRAPRRRRGVPRVQRHRRQRDRPVGRAAALAGRHLPGDGAHQRRRVRRPGALRRRQAGRRAHAGRQAHAGAAALAGSSASATSTTCRRRSSSISQSTELGTVYTPAELRRSPTPRTRPGCCCTMDGARLRQRGRGARAWSCAS